MSIEKGDDSEQLQLIETSREELLESLCEIETKILELSISEKRHKDAANAVKNEIKTKVSDKTTLLNKINAQGKTTFVPFAVTSDDTGESSEGLSEEDLAAFGDDEDENPPVSAGEVIEGMEELEQVFSGSDENPSEPKSFESVESFLNDTPPDDFELGPEFDEQRAKELADAEVQHETDLVSSDAVELNDQYDSIDDELLAAEKQTEHHEHD